MDVYEGKEDKNSPMKELENLLILHEGIRLKPYKDTKGFITIGVGRNLEGKGISKEEALYLLGNDIRECENDLRIVFPLFDTFSESRKNALISMRFMGPGSFRTFKKMIAAIHRKDWKAASEEVLRSTYAEKDAPRRAIEIAEMIYYG